MPPKATTRKPATRKKPAKRKTPKRGGFMATAALGSLTTALVPIALTGTALAMPFISKSTKQMVVQAKKMSNSAGKSLKSLVPGSSAKKTTKKRKRKPASKKPASKKAASKK
jgi:hypothetical protein